MVDNEKIRAEFKRAIKYKRIGFFLLLMAAMPMALLEGAIKYILTGIIFATGIYFERQYKCPVCGFVFDRRVRSHKLIYCQNCSAKLQ